MEKDVIQPFQWSSEERNDIKTSDMGLLFTSGINARVLGSGFINCQERIRPYFPLSHGVRRVNDRTVLSGIIDVIKNGFQWKEVSREYGPRKTLYNRFIRWSRLGIFNKIFMDFSRENGPVEQLMIDATRLKARRTAASLLKKGLYPDVIGRTKGGQNTKLHAVCDEQGKPIAMALTSGQSSDEKGAGMLLDHLPQTEYLLADRGYDATWFGNALRHRGITPRVPSRKGHPPLLMTTTYSTGNAAKRRTCLEESRSRGG